MIPVYTLDSLLRRQYLVDDYISLIWTERFTTYGDFQIDITSTPSNRTLLSAGTLLAIEGSYYVMRIESANDETNTDGERIWEVKGRSLEAQLLSRVAKDSLSDLTTKPTWNITDTPANIMRTVFHDICVAGTLDPGDVFPFINDTTPFMPASNIPEPPDPLVETLSPTTVYDIETTIGTAWNLGFRILRQNDTANLYFDVYAGSDRTSSQSILTPVIFAPELDNFQNTSELTTIDTARNVAYVFSPAGFQMVYGTNVDPDTSGFDRQVIYVDGSSVTSTNPDIDGALIQLGKAALNDVANQVFQGLDGEISQSSSYIYGRDYNLGDIVEGRNSDAVTNNMRVTEQIFSSDNTGDKSYPTLVVNTTITTGSWLSWNNNKAWEDLDSDTVDVWENQP